MSNVPNWQNVVWADIFLNTHVNNYDSFVKPEIAWKILVCRNDVSTISRWIANVYGKCKMVKDCGETFTSESIVSKELSQERAIAFGITQEMVDSVVLEDAIPEMKDEILDCLCQHGICSTSEVGWKMLRRFSRAGLLPFLTDSWMNASSEGFHSNISAAALKQLFNICIDNAFPEVLSICLPHHGNTIDDLIAYFKVPPMPNAVLDPKDERRTWGVQVPRSSWSDIKERLGKYPPASWPPICSQDKITCGVGVHDLLHGQLPASHILLGGYSRTGKENAADILRNFSQGTTSSSSAEEQIDFLYYLRQARPTYAATAFIVDQIVSHGSVQSDSISRACCVAQGLAMSATPYSMVGTACAAFVAMIGGSPDMLRLYLAAGRMCSANIRSGKGLQEPDMNAQTSDEYFAQLLSTLESRKPAIVVKDEHIGQLLAYRLNVSLAKVSGQALPEVLPRFFAENDLWLEFVLCLQIYRYPPEQVVSLVRSFKSKCLRDHLWHALQLVEPEGHHRKAVYYSRIGIKSERLMDNTSREHLTAKESLQTRDAGFDAPEGDVSLYSMLLRHHSRLDSLQPLPLIYGIPPNPTLAVLETCVDGNSNLESLCKWLIGTCWNFGLYESWKLQKGKGKRVNAPVTTDGDSVLEKQNPRIVRIDEIIREGGEADARWTQDDAVLLFREVIRHGYFSLLARGFFIFLPDSPLHPFTKSLAFAVEEMDFQKSLINLHYFKSQLTDLFQKETQSHRRPVRMSKDAIWSSRDVVQMSHSLILSALSMNINAPQQRLNLLGIFRQANLVEISSEGLADLDVLYGLQECLCKTGPESLGAELDFSSLPPLVTEYPSEEWKTGLKNCLHQLTQRSHFSIALQFAELAELPKDPVLIAEWKKNLESYSAELSKQRNPLYKDLNVTLGTSPVEACNSAFVAHGISPDVAARFFNSMADLVPSVKERYKMLKLALHWLGKANKVQFNLGAPEGSDVLSLEMEEVEMNIWKSRLELEMNEGLITDAPEGPCLLSLRMPSDKIRRRALMREQNISGTPSALGSLIGLHLDVGDLATAIRLESVFSHADRDISLLLTCMALAEGDMYPTDAEQLVTASEEGNTTLMPFQPSRLLRPGSLQSLSPVSLKSHFMRRTTQPEDLSAMTKEQTDANCKVLSILERIVNLLQRGKMLGLRIVTCFRLAFYLDIPYLDILNLSNPMESLCHHLRGASDNEWASNPQLPQEDDVKQKLTLASDILLAARLDRVGKAEFLQHEIVGAIQKFGEPGNTRALSGKVNMWGLPLDDNFPAILDLCEDDMTCSLLGDLLLLFANEQESSQLLSHREEVELLIRAHDCHSRSCNMEGISRILRQARILTSALLAAEEWSLMVRLLTGIKRYTEMNYILLILKEHNHFEYVLGKGMDKVPGLKVALLDFLRRHCPGDKEYLWLVVLHFRLHSETAELWLSEAETLINSIGPSNQKNDIPPQGVSPPDRNSQVKLPRIQISDKIMADLKLAIQNYTHAAEFYLQANQPIAASKCAHKAELAALQIYMLDSSEDGSASCILHLEPLQIAALVTNVLSFPHAWILVRAYEVLGNWAAAIYVQYVQGGDSTYLSNFMRCRAVTPTLVEDIARRFLLDDGSANPEMSQRMANLLTEMNDIEVCYRLSSRLGLRGLTGQLLTSPHLPYLRDVVWVGGTTSQSTR
ncbi:spatacsin isoform X2 [Hetaerina americana]